MFAAACDAHCTDGCTAEGAGKCQSTCDTDYGFDSTNKVCLGEHMFLSHGSGMNVNVDSYIVSVQTRSNKTACVMYTK